MGIIVSMCSRLQPAAAHDRTDSIPRRFVVQSFKFEPTHMCRDIRIIIIPMHMGGGCGRRVEKKYWYERKDWVGNIETQVNVTTNEKLEVACAFVCVMNSHRSALLAFQ